MAAELGMAVAVAAMRGRRVQVPGAILRPATICAPSRFLHCVELEVVNVFDIAAKKNRILLYLLFAVKGEMPYIGTSIFSCSINLPLPAGKQ